VRVHYRQPRIPPPRRSADRHQQRGDSGDANFPIDDQWFGVLFGMFVIWGLGLLIHLAASIGSRGFEDLRA